MSLLTHARERLRALLGRERMDADLDDELRFHIERDVEERVRRGADPSAARREARVAFGGIEQRKEQVRDARGVGPLENFGADLRFAFRALRRDPVFAVAAALVLGLGIGATSAVYGVADAVLFADLPYREPQRIVRIYQNTDHRFGLSVVDIQAIASQQRSFESFGAVRPGVGTVVANRQPEQRGLMRATAGFFTVLGVTPAAGRLLRQEDELPGAEAVMVVLNSVATRWFGSASDAIGKRVTVDAVPYTVVGVLPPSVIDLAGMRTAVYVALRQSTPDRRGPFGIRAFARLRPGVTFDAAARDLASISERIFPVWKSSFPDSTTRFSPLELREAILGNSSGRQVGLLGAGVALVLLVAIVNVALLMLARVSAREPELAVRTALGAGRWRLARLLAAESLVLALFAALVGLGLATMLIKAAPALLPSLPRVADVTVTMRVTISAALIALVAALAASISPIASTLTRKVTALAADRRVGAGKHTDRARSLLVSAEFGLALPLLFCAGLLLNSFMRLERVNPGYDPDAAVAVSIGLPLVRYSKPELGAEFWARAENLLRESPALASAGVSTTVPPTEPGDINNFSLKDKPLSDGGDHVAPWIVVTNGYFDALRIPLLEGRLFTPADTGGPTPVVVVSKAWARMYYPNESAIGKQMISGGCTTCPLTTVVGVVGDVKYQGLAQPSDAVYEPFSQGVPSSATIVARVRGATASAAAFSEIRRVVTSLDPELALVETTLREAVDESLADPRRWASILGAFAASTLLLATVGIFGLMAYAVRMRRREIGVRMALGAEPRAVVRMIVARGMRYALAGSLVGVVIALVGSRWLRSFLFGVGATDPMTLTLVSVALLSAAAVACWLAARRAARIHPVEAITGG